MDVRPVSGSDDQALCLDIFLRSMNDLHVQQGKAPAERGDVMWMPASVTHFATTDPQRLVLAVDGGRPVAFGCAVQRDRFWFLSFLFVLPDSQRSGVGRAVLEALLPPPPERATMHLATVVESDQPVSTMLYAGYGMVPRVPLYWLRDLPAIDGLPELPHGIRAGPLSPDDHQAAMDQLDRALLGYARPQDHRLFASEAELARVYVAEDGSLKGYGYRMPDEWVCPVGAVDETITAGIVRDLLTGYSGDLKKVTIQIAGSAGRLLPQLLRAGMRASGGAQLLYCSNGRVPSPSYLLYGGHLP
jgi:GNAT superfamily N-acetyltransferase